MQSRAWGAVAEQVAQVQTFKYRMHMTTQQSEMEITVIASTEYGIKMQTVRDGKLFHVMYMIPDENVAITLMPERKKYIVNRCGYIHWKSCRK